MNIDRFKDHHIIILESIDELRQLSRRGVAENAVDIAAKLKALYKVVTQHLAIEDRILYPSLERSGDPFVANMSRNYQNDMQGIANAFIGFARQWSNATVLTNKPEVFRKQANTVLKSVYERMKREDREFYPVIEELETPAYQPGNHRQKLSA